MKKTLLVIYLVVVLAPAAWVVWYDSL